MASRDLLCRQGRTLSPLSLLSPLSPLSLLAAALALALLLGQGQPSSAATVAQVRDALLQAKRNPNINLAADAWLKLMNTRWGRSLNFAGDVTLLVPANFLFTKYRFSRLQAAQTVNLFNYHTVRGKYNFNQLVGAGPGTKFVTNYQSKALLKAWAPKVARWRIGASASGPRTPGEVITTVIAPNVYLGSSVFVHGINSVLTPPDFKGGPFASPIIK